MDFPFYVIKAFSSDPLKGNPAGVVVMNEKLSKHKMQNIASINSFPETVFLYWEEKTSSYLIWWFTPSCEVYEAGHATLATQYLLFEHIHKNDNIDALTLCWDHGNSLLYRSEFNRLKYKNESLMIPARSELDAFFGGTHAQLYTAENDVVMVLDSCDAVKKYKPDLDHITQLPYRGVCITASDAEYDYCCRFFAPKYGVIEDYVTASAHKYLSVFWGRIKDSPHIVGIQHSNSPGIVKSQSIDNQLLLFGNCCIYSQGTLTL